MSKLSKRVAVGIAALSVGVFALSGQPAISLASTVGAVIIAQADGTKGKSSSDPARPATPAPGNPSPQNQPAIQSPSPTLQNTPQNTPQSGVPARCAAVADANERQKCMNTPKGQ